MEGWIYKWMNVSSKLSKLIKININRNIELYVPSECCENGGNGQMRTHG